MAGGWDNIIGQENIIKLFSVSIKQNKVNHAYIIEGDEGMGKKITAYTFANYLVCEEGNVCGKCYGCAAAKTGSHPDILTVLPEEGKKAIGVEDIREIVSDASVKPYIAKKKIIILPKCDGITVAAQNALLKVLEEPPEYIVFLLLIQNSNYLLETIRSRSIKLTMQPYTTAQLRQGLQRYTNIESEDVSYILSYAGNNLGRAVKIAQDTDFTTIRNTMLSKITVLADSRQLKMYELIKFFEENKENAQMLLDCMLSVFRDIMLEKTGCLDMLQNTDAMDVIMRLSDKISMQGCVIITNDIIKTKEMLSRNANFNLLITALINGSWEAINGRNSRSVF